MKKISAVLWPATAAMMLTACGGNADSAQTDAPASDTSQQADAQDQQGGQSRQAKKAGQRGGQRRAAGSGFHETGPPWEILRSV